MVRTQGLIVTVQTSNTIASGREALTSFSILLNVHLLGNSILTIFPNYSMTDFILLTELHSKDERWNEGPKKLGVLKNHTCAHVFDNIHATCVYNTKPNKKMHGPIHVKESYQRQTNFKNVAEQVCITNPLQE